jgi:hypothetical protein
MGGHLKVTKIYDDHKEVILDDSNMLTQGFNVNIVSVLAGEVLEVPTLIPGYFQLGASGMNPTVNAAGDAEVRADDIFYHLSAPLSTTTQYGNETPLELEKLNRSFLASTEYSSESIINGTAIYSEMLWLSAPEASTTPSATLHTSGGEWFVPIRETHIAKNYLDSIEVTLELDKNTANDILIREFGLFSKNAVAYKNNKPFLIAYKQLSSPITKKSEFSLLIEWSLGFIGKTNIYDNITPGFK